MVEKHILIAVEEWLNCEKFAASFAEDGSIAKQKVVLGKTLGVIDSGLLQMIALETEKNEKQRRENADNGSALYREFVIPRIKRLRDRRFLKKNGEVKEAAFYDYACIDKTTWSDFKWGKIKPSKKTLLKLIFALQLGKTEAMELLQKGNCSLEPQKDAQDLVVCCILDYEENTNRRYTVDDIMEILDTCRDWGKKPYDSIYDTPEMIAERKEKG